MDRDVRRAARSAVVVASVGIEIALSILVGWWIGRAIDDWLGTFPWLTVVFLLIGAAAGFRGLWRTARRNWPGSGDAPGPGEGT